MDSDDGCDDNDDNDVNDGCDDSSKIYQQHPFIHIITNIHTSYHIIYHINPSHPSIHSLIGLLTWGLFHKVHSYHGCDVSNIPLSSY